MFKIKRALISVFNKTNVLDLARALKEFDVEIISTGGTAQHLQKNGIEVSVVEAITEFPEILQGRVKTLHPKIFGGILALRDDPQQMEELQEHAIGTIDLVVINLYPFEQTIKKASVSLQEALENIDIGGPCLIRAAAKNFPHVVVVTSPEQYPAFIQELRETKGEISYQTRQKLAVEAFQRTSSYDALIQNYLGKLENTESIFPSYWTFPIKKIQDLRYGENPHQQAAIYARSDQPLQGLVAAEKLHGKELSFNNLLDLNAAWGMVQEFEKPCVAIIKHNNPCGLAVAEELRQAFLNARATDPLSAFGGIVAVNRPLDSALAREMSQMFLEAIIAPEFEKQSLEILQQKKNLRLLKSRNSLNLNESNLDIKKIQGGILLQEEDTLILNTNNFKVVTRREPIKEEWEALLFAWRVVKWVKSNAIVFTTRDRTLGIGAGQMSRIDSVWIAAEKARKAGHDLTGSVVASDAFFPFRDGIDSIARAGATAIIQPGGSIRDEEVIAAANEHNLTMIFTGVRHFRH